MSECGLSSVRSVETRQQNVRQLSSQLLRVDFTSQCERARGRAALEIQVFALLVYARKRVNLRLRKQAQSTARPIKLPQTFSAGPHGRA